MCERRRDGAEAHVRAAAVTAESDDVDLLVLELALAHQDFEPGGGAERRGTGRSELRVHPGHDPRRRVVSGVRDVHAPGRPEDDGAWTRGLDHVSHDERGLASLAGAVSGDEELVVRDVLDALDRRKRRRFNCHH